MRGALYIVHTGVKLRDAIREFLADSEEPEHYKMCEAIAEIVAEAADMVAVTRDDLPKDFQK